jgi:chemotaxis protein histidine kinase CheA
MKRHLALGLTALAASGLLVACGSDDDGSDVQEANTEFCQDLRAYGSSLAAFVTLDPAVATKEEFEDAAEEVRSARADVAESRADLVAAELDNLETQADDLDGLLADAPDDAVIADIVTAAQVQVAQVQVSADAVDTAVCTAANSSTSEG